MTRNYPTGLKVGDVLHTKTGRTYTVTDYDSAKGEVSYAYIPFNAKSNHIVIDTRPEDKLNWVSKVTNTKGYKVWERRLVTVGDRVSYGGEEWEVVKDVGHHGTLKLTRTVTAYVNKDKVEVA